MRTGIRELHASLTEAGIQHVYVESPGADYEWQRSMSRAIIHQRSPRTLGNGTGG
jgi:hypothetical protein